MSVTMLSCADKAQPEQITAPGKVAINFSSNILQQSKATDAGFENDDRIGVYVTQYKVNQPSTLVSSGNYADNYQYKSVTSGFLPVTGPLYYPEDGSNVDIYSYYPYVSQNGTNFTFKVQEDQSTQSGYTKSDLMAAIEKNRAKSAQAVPLNFFHKLSKLVINLDPATLPGAPTEVRVKNMYTSATFKLADQTVVSTGVTGTSKMMAVNNVQYTAVVVPQQFKTGSTLVELDINGTTYTWTPKYDITFIQGVEHNYTLTFEGDENVIGFKGVINPWGKPDIENIIPTEIVNILKQYMPIYDGLTPPTLNGGFVMRPMWMQYSSIENDGMFEDQNFGDNYMLFSNMNHTTRKLDYKEKQASTSSYALDSYISGFNDKFTVFFITIGNTEGYQVKQATVISGTLVARGINDCNYAFVMVDNGGHPELVDAGTYRIFIDKDQCAEIESFPLNTKSSGNGKDKFNMAFMKR